MKVISDKRLFWFLKEGSEFDLSNEDHLNMYVQQNISKGKTSDIRKLFKIIPLNVFIGAFNRIKNYLPKEVKHFWEEWLADINTPTKKNT